MNIIWLSQQNEQAKRVNFLLSTGQPEQYFRLSGPCFSCRGRSNQNSERRTQPLLLTSKYLQYVQRKILNSYSISHAATIISVRSIFYDTNTWEFKHTMKFSICLFIYFILFSVWGKYTWRDRRWYRNLQNHGSFWRKSVSSFINSTLCLLLVLHLSKKHKEL